MNHTLLIALAIVGSIAAIVAMLILITKRQTLAKKKALWETFRALLSRYSIAPDVVEEFPHRILGLDTAGKAFVFVQHDDARSGEVILLKDVADCKVSKAGFTSSTTGKDGKRHSEEYINTISLLFAMRNGGRVDIPVYAEMLDGIELRNELNQGAEKWQQYIDIVIKKDNYALIREAV